MSIWYLSVQATFVRYITVHIYLENEFLLSEAHRRLVPTFRRVNVAAQRTARRTIYGQKGGETVRPAHSRGTAATRSLFPENNTFNIKIDQTV